MVGHRTIDEKLYCLKSKAVKSSQLTHAGTKQSCMQSWYGLSIFHSCFSTVRLPCFIYYHTISA